MKDLLAEVYEEKRTHELMRLSSDCRDTAGAAVSSSSVGPYALRPNTSSIDENTGTHDLWVDKYSPKSFPQLLSPEKINREVTGCIDRLTDK